MGSGCYRSSVGRVVASDITVRGSNLVIGKIYIEHRLKMCQILNKAFQKKLRNNQNISKSGHSESNEVSSRTYTLVVPNDSCILETS